MVDIQISLSECQLMVVIQHNQESSTFLQCWKKIFVPPQFCHEFFILKEQSNPLIFQVPIQLRVSNFTQNTTHTLIFCILLLQHLLAQHHGLHRQVTKDKQWSISMFWDVMPCCLVVHIYKYLHSQCCDNHNFHINMAILWICSSPHSTHRSHWYNYPLVLNTTQYFSTISCLPIFWIHIRITHKLIQHEFSVTEQD